MGHLSIEERDAIALGRNQGLKQNEIAAKIGRCPSVVSREVRRNKHPRRAYSAYLADRLASKRRSNRPLSRKMEHPDLQAAVCNKLEQNWAPQQVAERLELELGEKPVSHETSYAFVRRLPLRQP